MSKVAVVRCTSCEYAEVRRTVELRELIRKRVASC